MEVIIGLNSVNGISRERNANPSDTLKLTKKFTKPIIPIPKMPQNNMTLFTI